MYKAAAPLAMYDTRLYGPSERLRQATPPHTARQLRLDVEGVEPATAARETS